MARPRRCSCRRHGISPWRRFATAVAPAAGARWLEVSLHFFPDSLYEQFFVARLAEPGLEPDRRAAYEQALADTRASVQLVDCRRIERLDAR